MKKILLISHDASRTGAPILLLNLSRLLINGANFKIQFLLKKGGPLADEFKSIADVTIWEKSGGGRIKRIKNKISRAVERKQRRRFVQSFDIILSNTITNGDIDYALNGHPRIITYVHELREAIKFFTTSLIYIY